MQHLNPTREQFKAMYGLPLDKPVMMLNLLKFRDRAAYAEGDPEHGEDVSGADAYGRYSEEATPIFDALGASQAWIGKPELVLIGDDAADLWDLAFVARYPTAQAFIDMVKDPAYQRAVRHRNAAVLDSRLIRCSEEKPGRTFLPGA
jgi:uncharacterized protein (DUF1330 family)